MVATAARIVLIRWGSLLFLVAPLMVGGQEPPTESTPGQGREQVVVRVGDGTVDGRRIPLYATTWRVWRQTASGNEEPRGFWADTLSFAGNTEESRIERVEHILGPVGSHAVRTNVARAAVAEQLEAGWTSIEIYQQLTDEVYGAIESAAREHGVPFEGHVPHRVGLRGVLDGGQRSIEHLGRSPQGSVLVPPISLDSRLATPSGSRTGGGNDPGKRGQGSDQRSQRGSGALERPAEGGGRAPATSFPSRPGIRVSGFDRIMTG